MEKTRALVAYLVASARPHSRAHLCELLWDGPDDPRAALRWSLTKLRSVLDEAGTTRVMTDHDRAWFDPVCVSIDLRALRAETGADPAAASTEILRRAADLFRG